MAVITLDGQAANWADAALRAWPEVERYGKASFLSMRRQDREDAVERLRGVLLRVASQKWRPGEGCRLSLVLLTKAARAGWDAHGGGKGKKHRMQCLTLQLAAKFQQQQVDTKVDLQLALEQMTPRERKIILMLLEGHWWQVICKECHTSVWTISMARETLRDLLTGY